jgi:hypothetical protein
MMTEQTAPGTPARLNWFELSEDLEAVFVAARRLSTVVRLQTMEHGRLRVASDARLLRQVWADANHLLTLAEAELERATRRLADQAAGIVGLALDAEDEEA